MSADEWIAKRDELIEAATEGPWYWEEPRGDDWPQHDESLVNEAGEDVLVGWGYDASGIEGKPADRALIADARTSLPTSLKALKAVLAFARAERDKISRTYIEQPNTAYAGYANAMDDVIRIIESVLSPPTTDHKEKP